MRILLANPRGFSAGVRMAVDALEVALERLGPPVYVFHEIAVQDVVSWFVTQFDASVESRTFMNERQIFALPQELASLGTQQESFSTSTNES